MEVSRADRPPLTPIRRPGATGGTRRQFWDLVWLSASADFKRRYAQTTFGYVWTILDPLLLFAVMYAFFATIVERFVGEIPYYPAFLLFSIMLFQFFREATTGAMRSLISGGGVIRKMSFPRLALPTASILAATMILAVNLVIAVIFILATGVPLTADWLFLPVLIAWLLLLTAAVGVLLAGTMVYFRDIDRIWRVVVRTLFYASPVMFPLELIPKEVLYDALAFNPLAPLFVQARVWLIDPSAPSWFGTMGTGITGFLPFIITLGICGLAVVVFPRAARRAADNL